MAFCNIFAGIMLISLLPTRAYKWNLKKTSSFGFLFMFPYLVLLFIGVSLAMVFGQRFMRICQYAGEGNFQLTFADGNLTAFIVMAVGVVLAIVGLTCVLIIKALRKKLKDYTQTEEFKQLAETYERDVQVYIESVAQYKQYRRGSCHYRRAMARYQRAKEYEATLQSLAV